MFGFSLLYSICCIALFKSILVTADTKNVHLGSCNVFAVHAGKALNFHGLRNFIYFGFIGLEQHLGITGSYVLDGGNVETGSNLAMQCSSDKLLSYIQADQAICTIMLEKPDLSGLIFFPGVYCTESGSMTISDLPVTLDGEGRNDAVWIFKTTESLVTRTGISFLFKNGALASNIYWKVSGRVSIGPSSEIVGTIIASDSITFGSNSKLYGRALAIGKITFLGENTVTSFADTSHKHALINQITDSVLEKKSIALMNTKNALMSGALYTTIVDIGSCEDFAIQGGTSVSFDGKMNTITTGSIGVSPGTSVSGIYTLENGNLEENTILSKQCAYDEIVAYNQTNELPCVNVLDTSDLSGMSLTSGIYCTLSGAILISSSSLTLDGQDDSSSVWVFQSVSTLVASIDTSVVLINGAIASNVFWKVGSSATLSGTEFIGVILASASITLGTTSVLIGRAFAQAGVTITGNNTISPYTGTSEPTGTPSFSPTDIPIITPTCNPTSPPSSSPTEGPTVTLSHIPSVIPTAAPTLFPSNIPSTAPSFSPSPNPSISPTLLPSVNPSITPTNSPSSNPTIHPSNSPTKTPTCIPTISPSNIPTTTPTVSPSNNPSNFPSNNPSASPTTRSPTIAPSVSPSLTFPTLLPSSCPTNNPSISPTTSIDCSNECSQFQFCSNPSSAPVIQVFSSDTSNDCYAYCKKSCCCTIPFFIKKKS